MYLANSQYAEYEIVEKLKNEVSGPDDIFFVAVGEKSNIDIQLFIDHCNRKKVRIFGGVFPAVINNENVSSDGINYTRMLSSHGTEIVRYLNFTDINEFNLNKLKTNIEKRTLMVLVDGLASGIDKFLGDLYKRLGNTVNYIGGGAGSLSLKQKPCVFCNDGFFDNGAVICMIDTEVKLGVKHGWKSILGPFMATKADGNVIKELNWVTPFKLYSDIIKEDIGEIINKENFFEISKNYPFGISKDIGEFVVRDPISVTKKGDIVCVGEIHQNSMLDILKGDKQGLIEAARESAETVVIKNKKVKNNIIFDCISRSLFLEDEYHKEIETIQSTLADGGNTASVEGVLSLGEISSYGKSYLEFFNKTILLGVFYE